MTSRKYPLPFLLLVVYMACAPSEEFQVLATVDVGLNPHQIAFSPDGATAYVAAAGSDQVAKVDTRSRRVTGVLETADTPLGVAVTGDGSRLIVSRFGADALVQMGAEQADVYGSLETGGGPSLLVGPLPGDRYLVSTEQVDRLWVLRAGPFALERAYETGIRPFPPAATSDGRLVFVPNYDGGTVTVIDLWNERVVGTVAVGEHPSGGAVLPDDIDYAVAVRGENKILFINTASRLVVDSIIDGIGDSPFSVVVAPNGRLAFVNNTASHDISVIDLGAREVVKRLPVGEIPIVMAVHPSGETLWVSSEGSDELSIIEIPRRWQAPAVRAPASRDPTEVAVLGMIHGRHRTSAVWGLDQVRETIERFAPDGVCAEIPPDRLDEAWRDFREDGVIEEPRVRVFPEYTDLLFAMAEEQGFAIIPCAGWTTEMNELRRTRLRQFSTEARFAEQNAEYERRIAAVRAEDPWDRGQLDDPHIIHSDLYDARVKAQYAIYDEVLNDWIGPGGWTNINDAHMYWIDRAIAERPGRRLLMTFGAAHRYWILEHLRDREDVTVVDIAPFLPGGER
ncbi:MAG: YncE family protein [Gemmatimonadetes bacterium]|nr:YncE family protein [Gemmatimonadota bacterium]